MDNLNFSFVILTFNEELHLPRLLDSIKNLNAATYVLDSGSTDQTLNICKYRHVKVAHHRFENHPRQWDKALKTFKIKTPWVIGLDADQVVSPELNRLLYAFKHEDHIDIDGIYFNRKNFFKGRWIKHGGYFPKYMLKMFRYTSGYSDLNQLMDHRFIVPGKTRIWKTGYLIEENFKENHIGFWVEKHNKYSNLLAQEEHLKRQGQTTQNVKSNLWGPPNEHTAWLKKYWWKLPLYLRPFLYFGYRMTFQLGFLDGKTGMIFHFLQGFWFRLIVDMKIEERKRQDPPEHHSVIKFAFKFVSSFVFLYGFHLAYMGLCAPGGLYISFLDEHLNYIKVWRTGCITSTQALLKYFGYQVITTDITLKVEHHAGFRLIYSCLGYGVMSYFIAFVIAFPKPLRSKLLFLFTGLILIQGLNILRLTYIAIYWRSEDWLFGLDHHDLFNCGLYVILGLLMSIWLYFPTKRLLHANPTKKIV